MSITSHRNAHLVDSNMHEVKGFPSASRGYAYQKGIQGLSEWLRVARRPNVLGSNLNGYEAPTTEVAGDLYTVTAPNLRIDGLVWQSATTVRVTFVSGYSNIYATGNYLQINSAANEDHNGVFIITAINASYLEVTIAAITDGASDVATGSTAFSYVTHEDFDPESLLNSQSIPREGIVYYDGDLDLWFGDAFFAGDEMFNTSTETKDIYTGDEVVSEAGIFQVKVSISAADLLAGTKVEAVAAQGAGKAIEVQDVSIDYTYVSAVYDTATTLSTAIDTAAANQFTSTAFLGTASSVFFKGKVNNTAATSLVANKKLEVFSNAASTLGDGTLNVYITYRIITL